jgi:hypothetical protein
LILLESENSFFSSLQLIDGMMNLVSDAPCATLIAGLETRTLSDLLAKLFFALFGCGECSIDIINGLDNLPRALDELIRQTGEESDKFRENVMDWLLIGEAERKFDV